MQARMHRTTRRGSLATLCGIAVIAAAAVLLVESSTGTPSARAGSQTKGLSAYVVATNPGPLPPCSDADSCTPANLVVDYIHVVNRNRLVNQLGSRLTVPNTFVIDSIDLSVSVNGQQYSAIHLTPPPNITPSVPGWSARWPATVLCDGVPPCTDVQNPAVVPGEDIAAFILGWYHGDTEPNGRYVFTYTIHGTLNGNAVDLTAASPPIQMTG